MEYADLLAPPPSPLVEIADERWTRREVRLFVKRDDLLFPTLNDPLQGNKWRKLQHNLLAARAEQRGTLLTFGGAFSNHLAAVASAGRHLGFRTIGMVRGDAVDNPTLSRAQRAGMELHFVDRTTYRKRNDPEYLRELQHRFGAVFMLPEGGTNPLAYPGCAALAREIEAQSPILPTHVALACGTGGTLTGLLTGWNLQKPPLTIGISALKGSFLVAEVKRQLASLDGEHPAWEIQNDYHHGGYARRTRALDHFIQEFYTHHDILLEPIYTGKLFYAMYDLLEQGKFPAGSRVVGVHTGGLQAFASMF